MEKSFLIVITRDDRGNQVFLGEFWTPWSSHGVTPKNVDANVNADERVYEHHF